MSDFTREDIRGDTEAIVDKAIGRLTGEIAVSQRQITGQLTSAIQRSEESMIDRMTVEVRASEKRVTDQIVAEIHATHDIASDLLTKQDAHIINHEGRIGRLERKVG